MVRYVSRKGSQAVLSLWVMYGLQNYPLRSSRSARPLASNSARLNFTLSPHNFHALVESCGHNRRGYTAWGIGDASIGHFPGHQSRLVAPPLSTGAALYARPGAEVVRASRPISPSA